MKPEKKIIYGQSSWRLACDTVEGYVTETGGHLGPVTFKLGKRKIQPFSIAPWAEEKLDRSIPPILKVLRGDFFCLPFGGNSTPYRGEHHPPHGETANNRWKFESLVRENNITRLNLCLQTHIRKGDVKKKIALVDNHSAVYSQHIISGNGPMCLGHHAMLRFPDYANSGLISSSHFLFGQVFPGNLEKPENKGYSALSPGHVFHSLKNVLTKRGIRTDLGKYPARKGYEDLVLLVGDPRKPYAWTAVTFPKERYVWFALKDPRILRHTILWISNSGRYYPPWSGRHVNVMGLEEVTSYFHLGLAESASRNSLQTRGYKTCVHLTPDKPLVVNYIMSVQSIPSGFDRVMSIKCAPDAKSVILKSGSGKLVKANIYPDFISSGNL